MREATTAAIERVVPIALDVLATLAEAKLDRTAQTFKKMLPDAVKATPTGLEIKLTGIAKALEEGYPARDMKPDMLNSPNAKMSEKGVPYVDVPFRHVLEGDKGVPHAIKTMVRSNVRDALRRAKALGRAPKNPMRVTPSMPGEERTQHRFDKRGKTKAVRVEHQTSIHSDMLRVAKRAGSRVVGTYKTIRRISANSEASAWWHPGYGGMHIMKTAEEKIRKAMTAALAKELKARGLK